MAVDPELIPEDEDARLAAVRRYDILDTPPDGAFDRVTSLAARHFGVPISIVSIVDTDRIWFKSHHGVDVEEIGRDPGLCASAILQDGPWVVEDAAVDPRTLANPLVAGDFGLRFYAGAPLTTRDGFNLGTLCLLDTEPRELSDDEARSLEDMAAIVMDELELRLSARTAVGQEHELRAHAEETARILQESLLPAALPAIPGLEVDALYRPADASEVGGDFYDVFELGLGGWAVVLGDVSGKGASAAAVTALVRHTVRTASLSIDDPAEVMSLLNRSMFVGHPDPDIEHFCTVHLSFLRPSADGFALSSASAGHPPALLLRGNGDVEEVTSTGPPVGWDPAATFGARPATLAAGDTLLLYTDGLSEARRPDGFVGEVGICRLLKAGGGTSAVLERLNGLLADPGVEVRDDVAAVVLAALPR